MLLFADTGYGKIEFSSFNRVTNHKKGIYLHAGFWLNHTLMDPHVKPLVESVKKARHNAMDQYIMVNGQSFKNFILNLEVIMAACASGDGFDLNAFYSDYFRRLFGIEDPKPMMTYLDDLAGFYLSSSKRTAYLSSRSEVDRGYQAFLMEVIYPLIQMGCHGNEDMSGYSNEALPYEKPVLEINRKDLLSMHGKGIDLLKKIEEIASATFLKQDDFFIDQYVFPQKILTHTLEWAVELYGYVFGDGCLDEVLSSHRKLLTLIQEGSGLDHFDTWYHIGRSRQHHPIPELTIYDGVLYS